MSVKEFSHKYSIVFFYVSIILAILVVLSALSMISRPAYRSPCGGSNGGFEYHVYYGKSFDRGGFR